LKKWNCSIKETQNFKNTEGVITFAHPIKSRKPYTYIYA
jgi:hypothetical protein